MNKKTIKKAVEQDVFVTRSCLPETFSTSDIRQNTILKQEKRFFQLTFQFLLSATTVMYSNLVPQELTDKLQKKTVSPKLPTPLGNLISRQLGIITSTLDYVKTSFVPLNF